MNLIQNENENMTRKQIIQKLIDKINAQSYVEIGLGNGRVFKSIKCKKKYGIDPEYGETHDFQKGSKCSFKPTHPMTSDDFFLQNQEKFDVIFIDGLHEAHQVEKDINNSLESLNDNGFIVCHDMSPMSEAMQRVPRTQVMWTGDCWKAWVKVRSTNPNVKMFVVNTDYGCGVIQKGSQELLDLNSLDLTYENLNEHRKEWLNLISFEDFLMF